MKKCLLICLGVVVFLGLVGNWEHDGYYEAYGVSPWGDKVLYKTRITVDEKHCRAFMGSLTYTHEGVCKPTNQWIKDGHFYMERNGHTGEWNRGWLGEDRERRVHLKPWGWGSELRLIAFPLQGVGNLSGTNPFTYFIFK